MKSVLFALAKWQVGAMTEHLNDTQLKDTQHNKPQDSNTYITKELLPRILLKSIF
jgi:hypothetical protein